MRERRNFYVYVYFRPNGCPCYVGKGTGGRWKRNDRRVKNTHFCHILNNAGGKLPVVKVRENLTEAEAFETETAFIKAIGRECDGTGPLVNLTLGGEGTSGHKASDEWRANRSKRAKEVWQSEEHRRLQSELRKGNQHSKKPHTLTPEWHAELTEKMKGNAFTLGRVAPEHERQKMRDRWADPIWKVALMKKRRASGMYSHERTMARIKKRSENYDKKKLELA